LDRLRVKLRSTRKVVTFLVSQKLVTANHQRTVDKCALINALFPSALNLFASRRSCSDTSLASDRLRAESVGDGALDPGVDAENSGDDGVEDEAVLMIENVADK
jgi:hypothetical protein